MFECPQCGFRDSPCWRASHWFLYTITTKIDELEFQEPALAKKLKASLAAGRGRVEKGPYVYRLTKKGRVYRVLRELEGEYTRGHWQEKPKKRSSKQKKRGA